MYLPLHYGAVPKWLFERMVKLGKAISQVIIEDLGRREYIRRLGNPFWFQAFGCALGFDWHSSGLTTVLTRVLKEIFKEGDDGIFIIGGKGREMITIPAQLDKYSEILGNSYTSQLRYFSKLAARTDTFLLQDGYDLYHQAIIFNDDRDWVLVEQGMNTEARYARRYHWDKWDYPDKYINEPHAGIMADRIEYKILNLIDSSTIEAKKTMLDIVNSKSFKKELEESYRLLKVGLYKWISNENPKISNLKAIIYPRKINWRKVKMIYENKPSTIPELLEIKYTDREIIRGLALVSYLIYGNEIEWKDTVKYTFTVGGKDGVPYPIHRDTYDSLINYLREAVEGSELTRQEKKQALKRLSKLKLI